MCYRKGDTRCTDTEDIDSKRKTHKEEDEKKNEAIVLQFKYCKLNFHCLLSTVDSVSFFFFFRGVTGILRRSLIVLTDCVVVKFCHCHCTKQSRL